MGTIKDEALSPNQKSSVKNVADLEKVSVLSAILYEKDSPYPYSYIEDNGTRYRIAKSVIKNIGIILKNNPKIEFFKVIKTGSTKDDTSYTVIPLA